MSDNKKGVSALLVCLFSLQILLPFILFVALSFQREYQKEIISDHYFEKNYFEKIILNEKEFESCKISDGEIVLNNDFFDIHSIEKKNGKYIIYVIADNKETSLQKTIKKEPFSVNSNKLLVFSFFFYEDYRLGLMKDLVSDPVYSINNVNNIDSIKIKVPTPPPDNC